MSKQVSGRITGEERIYMDPRGYDDYHNKFEVDLGKWDTIRDLKKAFDSNTYFRNKPFTGWRARAENDFIFLTARYTENGEVDGHPSWSSYEIEIMMPRDTKISWDRGEPEWSRNTVIAAVNRALRDSGTAER